MEKVPVGSLSKETYCRLYAPLLLPPDLGRILYLDIDMIITGSIREIYESNFNDILFMAVRDTSLGIEEAKKTLHMKNSDIYVNAGVLLMNLDLLRKEFDMERLIGYAAKHPDNVLYHDQDLINKFYHERIGYLNWIYNYEARFHSVLEILLYPIQKKNLLKEVRIVHYMGGKKTLEAGF